MGGRTGGGRVQHHIDRIVREAIAYRRPICVDSSVLIAYISNEEPIATHIAPILENLDLSIVVSAITLAEVVTRPVRVNNRSRIEEILAGFEAFPGIQIIEFDQDHAIETAFVRGQTRLKLPNAAIVATARLANAFAIIGNDRRWRNKSLGVPYHHMDDILALQ